ncbi:MAG: SDR family NAD(P)-dependent oxidoreductase [Ardenticatenaceae bacterium]
MTPLTNKVAIITGAAGGLGRAFAIAFAEAGAAVACADVNWDGVQESAELIIQAGGRAIACKTDVTDAASTDALVQQTLEQWGRIDILVNNAAIYAGIERKPFWEIDEAMWDRVMAVNVKGIWQMSKSVAPQMFERGGKIINIASATFYSGSPGWLHYVASKGASIGMTRSMARELGDHHITVNAIAPGFTLTDASLNMMDNAARYGVNRGAIKRASQTDDIIGTALYLASSASDFVTGQTIVVDGGRQFN